MNISAHPRMRVLMAMNSGIVLMMLMMMIIVIMKASVIILIVFVLIVLGLMLPNKIYGTDAVLPKS